MAKENKPDALKHLYEDVLNRSDIGVWELDIKNNALFWSEMTYKIHELPINEKIDMDMAINFYPFDHRKQIKEAIEQAIENRIGWELDLKLVTANNNKAWVKTKGFPVEENGRVIKIRGTFENIDSVKSKEERLRESEERYQLTVKHSSIGIALVGLDGAWLSVNSALCELTGYSEGDLLKIDFQTITHPDDLNSDLNYVNQILSGEINSYEMEKRYIHKNGDIIWIQLNVSTVKDKDENPIYFIAQIQDITARKRMNKILEERVKKRTQQLKNVNEELKAFNYSVSHDLRSPLRSIHGFCQALQEDFSEELPDQAKNYLDRVIKASVRMGDLIDDLLNLSRISQRELNFDQVNLTTLANQVIENFPKPPSTKFIVHNDIYAKGDVGLLRIVLENLIGNAIKYADHKKELTIIEIGQKQRESESVFFVKDNGVGFNMQYAGKLFGTFQRLHSSKEFEGTGIGLATVKRIVNRHGGAVWAESELSKGTTFYFTIGADK